MQLPHSKIRAVYIDQIKITEATIKDAMSDGKNQTLLLQAQKHLDALAEKYQYSEEIGTARYKLYELQAMVHYFNSKDDDALDFVNQAIEIRGGTYARAEKLKSQLSEKTERSHTKQSRGHASNEPPLQLQALIRGQRSSAIIMAILSVLSIYFIPWAIFYIVLAAKLKPQQVPSRGLIKAAAIATLPLCLGLIPIIIDMEFWRMNKKLKEYEELGVRAFVPDKEYSAAEPKRKKSRVIAWSILLSILAILTILIIGVVATSRSSNQISSGTSLAESSVIELKSNSKFALPKEIDDVTTLTNVTSNGNTIQYRYILHDADTSNLSDDAIRVSIQPGICANTFTKYLLDHGVDMQYLYTVQGTSEQYSFTVTQDNC